MRPFAAEYATAEEVEKEVAYGDRPEQI